MIARANWKEGAFAQYLRTGRVAVRHPVEMKFNPYHDPDDGRFTFKPGGGTLPKRRRAASLQPASMPRVSARHPAVVRPANTAIRAVPAYLQSIHAEINELGARHRAAPGTREWTPLDAVGELVGLTDDKLFKRQWVRGYRTPIKAAADRFNLPSALVAGIAYNEVSGDPEQADAAKYALTGTGLRDQVSFGPLSVQVRRAADALGYGSSDRISESARRAIIASLEHRETNIFIAAKHLSDLRDRYVKGVDRRRFSRREIEALGTLYNRGPSSIFQGSVISSHYGREIGKHWLLLQHLLRD